MSDYWSAVARAAIGTGGSAEPRARSMFEEEYAELSVEPLQQTEGDEPIRQPELVAPAAPLRMVEPAATPRPQPQVDARQEESALVREPPALAAPLAHRDAQETVHGQPPSSMVVAEPVPQRVILRRLQTIERVVQGEPRLGPERELPDPQDPPVAEYLPKVSSPSSSSVPERESMLGQVFLPDEREIDAAPPVAEIAPLRVEIGRIEIRIAAEASVPSAAPRPRTPRSGPTLQEYLATRSGLER